MRCLFARLGSGAYELKGALDWHLGMCRVSLVGGRPAAPAGRLWENKTEKNGGDCGAGSPPSSQIGHRFGVPLRGLLGMARCPLWLSVGLLGDSGYGSYPA